MMLPFGRGGNSKGEFFVSSHSDQRMLSYSRMKFGMCRQLLRRPQRKWRLSEGEMALQSTLGVMLDVL